MNQSNLKLKQLYKKMPPYQSIPHEVIKILQIDDTEESNKYERQRMDFLKQTINFKDAKIADIGGNAGYFSFEAIKEGAKKIIYYEGDDKYSDFVEEACKLFNKNICIKREFVNLEIEIKENPFDIILLFNVIHHYGRYFGENDISMKKAIDKIKMIIRNICKQTKYLVLQFGFNWKGNPNLPFFTNGEKNEMINFVKEMCSSYAKIEFIGIPEGTVDSIKYQLLNTENIKRRDDLGEFLNRPIFILSAN